ncbi:Ankyrin repeat [Dillenia turbinata]|uniref:Ankyrin repeat n=1 Tax=Dillenia turbinata TaxID=194707 RepID=A0AAN8ZJE4_9MAGN
MISGSDEFGWCPIHYAAHLGQDLLLEKDNSIAYNLNKDEMTPLHLAATKGNINIIKELVLFCPDLYDCVDNSKRTALHLAVKHGKTEIVRYMLKDPKIEIIINIPDEDGNTPLHLAAVCGKRDILMMLTNDFRVDKTAKFVKKLEKAGGQGALMYETIDISQDEQQQGDTSIYDQQMHYMRQESEENISRHDAVAIYCSTAVIFLHFFISIEHGYHLLLRFVRFATARTYVSTIGMVLSFTAGLYVVLPDSMSDVIVALSCCFSLFYLFRYI